MELTPNQPYLLRAFYEWIVDNDLTPYVLVDATKEGVQVPVQYVDNGKIVLNIAPGAVNNLELNNENVNFNARFAGKPMQVFFAVDAVQAIYAKENGQGMVFSDVMEGVDPEPPPPKPGKSKPKLKLV